MLLFTISRFDRDIDKYGPIRFLLSNRMSPNRTKPNGINLALIFIIVLLFFSVVNISVFTYNLYEDISNERSAYLRKCGSIVETASDHVCYGSIFRYIPVKSR